MRILFTFAGGTGHFIPLESIAHAAEKAGHTVAFAGQEGMIAVVGSAGFTAFPTGGSSLLRTDERTPLLEVDEEREARVVRESFALRIARERCDAILELCSKWRPDVLVCDEMDFGAVVAAEKLGLPHATAQCIATGSFVPAALVAEPVNELRAEHGLAPDPALVMLGRYLILSPFPPSLRDGTPTLHRFRLGEPMAAAQLPADLGRLHPPVIYLTLGTIFNLESGDLFERALAGLGELTATVVVTVGRELDPAVLGPQPAHVHVHRFVPQSLLLPQCDLVVSHAGSGSVLGALTHGLPMVLLPMGADQPHNARRAADLGVALTLDVMTAGPAAVRDAAAEAMSDPSYRQRAEAIRDEITALPRVEHAVELLEALDHARRPLGL